MREQFLVAPAELLLLAKSRLSRWPGSDRVIIALSPTNSKLLNFPEFLRTATWDWRDLPRGNRAKQKNPLKEAEHFPPSLSPNQALVRTPPTERDCTEACTRIPFLEQELRCFFRSPGRASRS